MTWDIVNNFSKYFWQKIVNINTEEEMGESSDDCINGLYLKGKTIPLEVLSSVLKWLDEDSLVFSCRLVCKKWKEVVDSLVWEEKSNYTKILIGPRSVKHVPWWLSYWIGKKHPFDRNLIKNNCGQEDLQSWEILENFGDQWLVEQEPVGTMDPLPQCEEIGNFKSCFVTSFHWCSKKQVIKLSAEGLSNKIMDELQPDFECSDWIAPRFDCGGVFLLYVSLFNRKYKPIGEPIKKDVRLENGAGWVKVSGKICGPYPKGARYIGFFHKGKDTNFWKGHYGIKITGSSVKPMFPKDRFLADSSQSSDTTEYFEAEETLESE